MRYHSDQSADKPSLAGMHAPRWIASTVASLTIAMTAMSVHAADGCQVFLCLAASNWRAVEQCVPPVQEVLRDLARGKAFPTCSMAGAGNSASHQWSNAPTFCPPQYTHAVSSDSGTLYACDYAGAVSVVIDGAVWARTWWSLGGDSVTEFLPSAKARLGSWDTRFDDDYAAWSATQSQALCVTC